MNAALADHGLPSRPPHWLERFIGPPLADAFADPVLTALGLRHLFAAVCGPDLSVEGETKAATTAAALTALHVPARAVMVGDRAFDVRGAHACGIPPIGVTWGIGDRAELEEAGADAVIETPAELPAAVDRLLHGIEKATTGIEPV